MAAARNFTISCHCGAARQAVAPRGNQSLFSEVSFCHCDSCRHLTGLLCASYAPISSHPAPSVAGLQSYSTSPASTRYFCSTCGCHVFRASRPSPSSAPEQWSWEVATGAVVDGPAPTSSLPEQWRHLHIRDTKDGGLSAWLPNADPPPQSSEHSPASPDQSTTLPASCHCRSISLQITRPSPDPALNPDSPYADLLLPYHSTPSTTVSNPSREKWYLRPDPALLRSHHSPSPNHQPQHVRYLAGTCACETCRLTSGFEIQTWSFIPRRNILIRLSQPGEAGSSTNPAATANASSHPDPQQQQQEEEQQHQQPQKPHQEQEQQQQEEQQQQQKQQQQQQQPQPEGRKKKKRTTARSTSPACPPTHR
ncbi:73a16fe7-1b47-4b2c-8e32-d1f8fd41fa75 [Thermothielavioides terrestris]|uniref:73a16fe7-1b47-4b2c-8e32-d1f8fd41fa75 n=1 Tax=Thermothielavioides terrestris TaxID=2587410 RepID=A0A3S4EV59_9PEZI|nr:73a16fe7-1b47-4b2c-8e32-d1f8fd41fa75 [Thermothielavioides terrestris]